ncbi:Rossmann-like alpha/beta/alpha sandwich fold containing protein [Parasponia andersonii]|uniref:Rossmann-like alpha/beta/alpha sandwich fold containing protein n=1 Tax=Parasponia andersonii TaxID=3476 RepID=A0A2P5ATU7_PARAD|nr:Rossmann-like alpha/beta/alpha sandwich fold containing protein [Parasponia andersonii]
MGNSSLADIEAAPPTAELEPIHSNYTQLDEVDMRMTCEELSIYKRLRNFFRCGLMSMFETCDFIVTFFKIFATYWGARLTPSEVAEKVKYCFKYYSIPY